MKINMLLEMGKNSRCHPNKTMLPTEKHQNKTSKQLKNHMITNMLCTPLVNKAVKNNIKIPVIIK